jgi:hypothetical protein
MKDYKDIIEKYPLLFDGLDPQEPLALFGFECNTGWYDIIEKACYVMYSRHKNYLSHLNYIQNSIDNFDRHLANRRTYDKTTSEEDILKELNAFKESYSKQLQESLEGMPKVVQVKEKFGTLRFYIDNGNDVSNAVTHYAELMSEHICEVCGNAGKTYYMSWHKTLCRQHAVERYGEEKVLKYEAND